MADGGLREALEALARASKILRSLGMVGEADVVNSVVDRCAAVEETGALPQIFRLEGEYWFIAFEDDAFRLKDSKGLQHLAVLLAAPGREIHVLDLVGGVDTGDAGPQMDLPARVAYRRRLEDLAEDLAEAQGWHDDGRVVRIQSEIDAIVDVLAHGEGLAGHPRVAASASERARQAATKAMRSAVSRIADHSAALGSHLASTVRTGTYCRYDPDPRLPVSWRT